MSLGRLEKCLSLIERMHIHSELDDLLYIFKYLADKEYSSGLKKAGSLTAEDMVKINEKVSIYQSLENLGNVVKNEIRNSSFVKKESPFKKH